MSGFWIPTKVSRDPHCALNLFLKMFTLSSASAHPHLLRVQRLSCEAIFPPNPGFESKVDPEHSTGTGCLKISAQLISNFSRSIILKNKVEFAAENFVKFLYVLL